MITQFFSRPPEFEIMDMTAVDTAEAAAVHSARFRRAWSDEEIHSLLVQTTVFGFVARRTSADQLREHLIESFLIYQDSTMRRRRGWK